MKKNVVMFVLFVAVFFVTPVFAQGEVPPATTQPVTVELLAGIAAGALSLIFSYFPAVRNWYEPKDGDTKRQIVGAAVLITAAVLYVLACSSLLASFGIGLTCEKASLLSLSKLVYVALSANQVTYLFTKKA